MASEPLILAFDTSAAHCAAALLSGDRCLAQRSEAMQGGQAERLFPLLEELLAEAGVAWRDLAALGVGTGPGSFTGVRVAVAAARGLALSLGVPAVGVSGFDALGAEGPRPLLASLDARRGACFLKRLDAGAAPPVAATPEALPVAWRGSGLPVVGHAAEAVAAATGGPVLTPRWPLAEAIARIAATCRDRPQPRPAPVYLRPADAAPPSDPPPVLLP